MDGARRALTSPITATLLLLLRQRPQSSVELAEQLGVFPSQLTPYLAYLRRKGWVTRNSFVWSLTPAGRDVVDKHYSHLEFIVSQRSSRFGINLNKLTENRINLKKQRILIRIKNEIKNVKVLEKCFNIIEFLVDYRLRTGRKYWVATRAPLSECLAEQLGSSSYTVSECLKELESLGLIYITIDNKRKLPKVRLDRHLDSEFR